MTEKETEETKEYFTADEDGEYVKAKGVLTQDEVDKQLEDFKTKSTKEAEGVAETHKGEIETLNEKIKKLEESDEDDPKKKENLVQLRKAKEAAEELLKATEEKFKPELDKIRKEIKDGKINAAIKSVIGDDAEVHTKVRLHYDNFKGDPKDRKEMMERIENAVILATGSKPTSPLGSDIIGTGAGATPGEPPKGKISQEAEGVAEKLGVTKKELKKHKLV